MDNLCEVRTIVFPLALTCERTFQNLFLATGSTPVDGSSRKITEGSPTRATAVLSLRLLPPLKTRITKTG